MLDSNPFDKTKQPHQINLKRLFKMVSQANEALFPEKHQSILHEMEKDHGASKLKGQFSLLSLHASENKEVVSKNSLMQRQQQHMS